MKIHMLAAMLFLVAPPSPSEFTESNSTIYRGDMRIDRVSDYTYNVVCYISQHHDGSSHTTPAINCLKMK